MGQSFYGMLISHNPSCLFLSPFVMIFLLSLNDFISCSMRLLLFIAYTLFFVKSAMQLSSHICPTDINDSFDKLGKLMF